MGGLSPPCCDVVPGHEFGISAWISSGLATNNCRKVVLDFFGTFSTLQQIFVPWCGHYRTPLLDRVITLWGKRGNWWNIKEGGGGNVAWDKSEWSWQSERSPLSKQSLLRSYLFSAYPHPSHNPFINTEKELLISRGSVDWVTQQLPWLDEISKLWELPKLFKIYIFSYLKQYLGLRIKF